MTVQQLRLDGTILSGVEVATPPTPQVKPLRYDIIAASCKCPKCGNGLSEKNKAVLDALELIMKTWPPQEGRHSRPAQVRCECGMGLMRCDWKVWLIRGWKPESDKPQLDADLIKRFMTLVLRHWSWDKTRLKPSLSKKRLGFMKI